MVSKVEEAYKEVRVTNHSTAGVPSPASGFRTGNVGTAYRLYFDIAGKTKELGWCMGDVIIYSKKKIFALNDKAGAGMYAMIYYKYDGKKVKEIARDESCDGEETYILKGKNVSKKKYNKYIKSLHLGKGISSSDLKMHQNIKENRKSYLK